MTSDLPLSSSISFQSTVRVRRSEPTAMTWLSTSMPNLASNCLASAPTGDAGGGFTGAGSFQNVAGVGEIVFDGAGEIGMAGARARDGFVMRGIARFNREGFGPVFPVGVGNNHGSAASRWFGVTHAGDDVGAIGFDLHATAASKALLPAPEFVLYCVNRDGYAGGEACEGRHQAFAVGLARRFEPEHVIETSILTEMLVLRHPAGKRRRRKRLLHITETVLAFDLLSSLWFDMVLGCCCHPETGIGTVRSGSSQAPASCMWCFCHSTSVFSVIDDRFAVRERRDFGS